MAVLPAKSRGLYFLCKGKEIETYFKKLRQDEKVTILIGDIMDWPNAILKRHNDAKHPLHKLTFLADLGFKKGDPQIKKILPVIFKTESAEGPFQITVNIPTRFGGSGRDEMSWFLCDAPLILYALTKFGLKNDLRVQRALEALISRSYANGWPCAASGRLGRFRGPGRKADPCPYATLLMLKLLALYPELHDKAYVVNGLEAIFTLWRQRKECKAYLFGMGTDFRKLKAPLIWYDILHLLDVFSHFKIVHEHPCFKEWLQIVCAKRDENGMFRAESVYRAWKEWDFGQKKTPSAYITILVDQILQRIQPE